MYPTDRPVEASMLAPGSIHIWIHAVSTTAQLQAEFLSTEEYERAFRFAFDRDRRVFVATRVMVRSLLSRYAQVLPEQWCFATNPYGRPEIVAPALDTPLYFNLSHTVAHVVVAIARVARIGIDIESRVPDGFETLAEDFFSEREISWLREASGQQATRDRFLTLWTLKEAYIKALGTGLSTALDSFSVIPDGLRGAVLMERTGDQRCGTWWFQHSILNKARAMAVAAQIPGGGRPQIAMFDYP